jgi:thioredoxin-like negative regulator of GroEL
VFNRSVKGPLVVLLFLAAVLPAKGQEINWRRDYRSAWKESKATQKPILLDFGTTPCVWCRQMDATTLRDPGVAGLINAEFIPLKVDARQEPTLTRALRIQSFPTVVLAGPDATVLVRQVGYADAGQFTWKLRDALARLPRPADMMKDYQEASTAIAAPNYPRAIALLQKVVRDGGNQPIQVQARQLLQEFEGQAANGLQWVKALEQKGQVAEASAALSDLVRTYQGTQAAREAGLLLSARAR